MRDGTQVHLNRDRGDQDRGRAGQGRFQWQNRSPQAICVAGGGSVQARSEGLRAAALSLTGREGWGTPLRRLRWWEFPG